MHFCVCLSEIMRWSWSYVLPKYLSKIYVKTIGLNYNDVLLWIQVAVVLRVSCFWVLQWLGPRLLRSGWRPSPSISVVLGERHLVLQCWLPKVGECI